MRTRIAIFLAAAVAAFGAFVTDRTDPAGAGMDAARLARIPARMQRYVDDGKAAGFVTLIARHGHVATLSAVGFLAFVLFFPWISNLTVSYTVRLLSNIPMYAREGR